MCKFNTLMIIKIHFNSDHEKKYFASCWIQTQDLLARVFLSGHILSCTDVHLFSRSVDPNRCLWWTEQWSLKPLNGHHQAEPEQLILIKAFPIFWCPHPPKIHQQQLWLSYQKFCLSSRKRGWGQSRFDAASSRSRQADWNVSFQESSHNNESGALKTNLKIDLYGYRYLKQSKAKWFLWWSFLGHLWVTLTLSAKGKQATTMGPIFRRG